MQRRGSSRKSVQSTSQGNEEVSRARRCSCIHQLLILKNPIYKWLLDGIYPNPKRLSTELLQSLN